MRQAFKDIIEGWIFSGLTEKIEQAAEWTKLNGPLEPDEEMTIQYMIQCQLSQAEDNQ
jgi:hypothetical protein